MMGTYQQLRDLQVPTGTAAGLVGVSRTTVYRKPTPPSDHVPDLPANRLSTAERVQVLEVLNSPRFVDMTPLQVYTKLLDEGIYVGSVSMLYRVLAENQQVKERRRLPTHPPRAIPELVATAPNQVLTRGITKLAGPVKGTYFDCYLMVDIFSRFIVGAHVHATESGVLAVESMTADTTAAFDSREPLLV